MINEWIQFKKLWTRGYSHLAIFIGVINLVLLTMNLFLLLKIPIMWAVMVGVLAVIINICVGVWDLKKKVFEKENESLNKHNPTLQQIKKRVSR